jgi:hypothetical protein
MRSRWFSVGMRREQSAAMTKRNANRAARALDNHSLSAARGGALDAGFTLSDDLLNEAYRRLSAKFEAGSGELMTETAT